MAFLIYFFVLLVSAASVLFGLDLMSSPLPRTPNVPIGRSVQVSPQPVPRQREAKAADEPAPTPARPTELVRPQAQTAAPRQETSLPPAPPQPAPPPPEPAATTAQAPQPAPQQQAAAAPPPAPQQAANSCNVQACAAAYQSFRASDCSYQPIDGPRRACAIPGRVAATALPARAAPRPAHPSARNAGLREGERMVTRPPLELRPGRQSVSRDDQRLAGDDMSEVERIVRHMTRDEAGDIPVQDADGRIFIVRKFYR